MDNVDKILRTILPYSEIVGQEQLKLALELAYISPRIGGVLISGQRGTAKSTTVRAFASMMYNALPVTIPINATEDRVVGGWKIQKLMDGKLERQSGLIEDAHDSILYIDEVNLLDDHIVNILLDVTSTGKLIVQREGIKESFDIHLTLVGTMNPEEGGLRPQLQDRFGLMVQVESLPDQEQRRQILKTVLGFDQALSLEEYGEISPYLERARKETQASKIKTEQAKQRLPRIGIPDDIVDICTSLTEKLRVEGHRADYLLALAARAHAARAGGEIITREDVHAVAELVLRHRITNDGQAGNATWNDEYEQRVKEIIGY